MSETKKNVPKESENPETKVDPKEEPKTTLAEEPKTEVSFFSLLKDGKIKKGDKVGFTPKGAKKEKVIVVDDAFLKLKPQKEEVYEEGKYNLK